MATSKQVRLARIRAIAIRIERYPALDSRTTGGDPCKHSPYVCDHLKYNGHDHRAYNDLFGEGVVTFGDNDHRAHITFAQMNQCDPDFTEEEARDIEHQAALIPQRLMMLAFYHAFVAAGDA